MVLFDCGVGLRGASTVVLIDGKRPGATDFTLGLHDTSSSGLALFLSLSSEQVTFPSHTFHHLM